MAALFGSLIAGSDVVFLLVTAMMLLTALLIFRRPDLGFGILFACAFFFAPLKDHFNTTLAFFLVDLVLFVMAAFWFMQKVVGRGPLFPGTPLTVPILAMAAYGLLMLAYPGRPLAGSLAGFRAWNLGAVVFFLAYDGIASLASLRRYFLMFVLMGAVVALYGIWQYRVGIDPVADPRFVERHKNAFFRSESGAMVFRPFATTVSAAELAMSLALLLGIALALYQTPGWSRAGRWLYAGAMLLFAYVLILTGSRTGQIASLLALAVLAVLRRNLFFLGMLLVAVSLAVVGGVQAFEQIERYRIGTSHLRGRLAIPVQRAWAEGVAHPFGKGLGYTQGVPLEMQKRLGIETTNLDNGFGAALLEMGWVGLALYVLLLWRVLRTAWECFRGAVGRERVLASAALFAALVTVVSCVAGNALYGYPHALVFWFILGGAAKVAALRVGEGGA